MHTPSLIPDRVTRQGTHRPSPLLILTSLALLGLLAPTGCLFRHKAPAAPATLPAPARILLLPANVPDDKPELQWTAFGIDVMLAESALAAPDLELAPLYESVPAVLQTLANSRHITDEIAEFTATRLTARWATEIEITPAKDALTLRVDFIPAKPSLVPFRYEKAGPPGTMTGRLQEACSQFLDYLIVRPLALEKLKPLDENKVKEIAQALNLEYGWFTTAKPGQAGKLVEELALTRPALAKLLFSPTLYPVLAK